MLLTCKQVVNILLMLAKKIHEIDISCYTLLLMSNAFKISLLFLAAFAQEAYAQSAIEKGTQDINMKMKEMVSAKFITPTGGSGNSNIALAIHGPQALANGIESKEITVTLQCTSDYDVSVASSSANFTYSGSSTSSTTMKVEDVLSIRITDNQTGGNISNGFTQYRSISGTQAKKIINAGLRGERSFSFQYRILPGFNYPGGTYTTDILYTLTKR